MIKINILQKPLAFLAAEGHPLGPKEDRVVFPSVCEYLLRRNALF